MANTKRMVNLNKIAASYNGNIVSFQWDGGVPLQNGTPIVLGSLVTGEIDLYHSTVTGMSGSLATAELLLFASPEVMYEAGNAEDDYYLATGGVGRAYHLTVGDVFTITSGTYEGTAAVGDCIVALVTGTVVTGLPGYLLTAETAAIAGWRLVSRVIELTTLGYDGDTAAKVRVIKNS